MYNKGKATKSFGKGNSVSHMQVVAIPLKSFVWFLLQNNNNITRLDIGLLVTFASEQDLLIAFHAFIDVDFKDFCFVAHFLTFACGTSIFFFDYFSGAAAVCATRLNLKIINVKYSGIK